MHERHCFVYHVLRNETEDTSYYLVRFLLLLFILFLGSRVGLILVRLSTLRNGAFFLVIFDFQCSKTIVHTEHFWIVKGSNCNGTNG